MTDSSRVMTPNHNKLVLGTPVATTSGTSFNFASLPSGIRRISIMFAGVSLSGTDNLLVQIGPSGGVETTGYISTSQTFATTPSIGTSTSTSGFVIRCSAASFVVSGIFILTLLDSSANTWVASMAYKGNTTQTGTTGGDKSLAGVLTQLTIKTDGSDTFDAGALNIMYER